ncbi:MAG TPA: IPT/TIG domain-containing protein [Polyangiaceae bacterium]|nr:IPT/TIG domain-containing protein [Polyangiaceae bacterium]
MRMWQGGAGVVVLIAACLPGSGPGLDPYVDDAGPTPATTFGDDAAVRLDVDLGDPFAITGVQPSHGPWSGGTRTTIVGRGFSSNLSVWIGGAELDPSAVFASDPSHVTVVTPPGAPGAADVRVQNKASAQDRTLAAGYYYDSFAVQPTSGATTGGTLIALTGSGTGWTSASKVSVGGVACTSTTFTDAAHLSCTTPAGAAGSRDVTVLNADGTMDQARDAFTYNDSPDGYRGGLYGGALAGKLTVLAFDSSVGTPLAGGIAVVGGDAATALTAALDASGTARFDDATLQGSVTVTVTAKCHQPITFVAVPVDTVTAYLDLQPDPSCGMGDPPSGGHFAGTDFGTIQGELVWQSVEEFQRSTWFSVPNPTGPNERQAAYVWVAGTNALAGFSLPGSSQATTPMSSGQLGYAYSLQALPGTLTLYALAGLEDRSVNPPRFQPFVIGVARGVSVEPNAMTVGVDIPMSTLLDHALQTVPQPPTAPASGPDRLITTLGVNLGEGTVAILPQGTQTSFLPIAGTVGFVGIPSLDGSLAGDAYTITAQAVTGTAHDVPLSVVANVETTDANDPLTLGGFLPIPGFDQPGTGAWSGAHVDVQVPGAFDLMVLDVASASGLVTWRIVAPGGSTSFEVPDLTKVPGAPTLMRGSIRSTLTLARINAFDYGRLRYGQFTSGAWNAYARDVAIGSY